MAYGAAESADQERPSRMGVVIGPDGKVVKAWPKVKVNGHAQEVLDAAKAL